MTSIRPADPLRGELLRRIRAGADPPISDAEFNTLALAVFGHQYEQNVAYRAYCERRGASPESVRQWTEIPAVPTAAFKAAPLVCGDPAQARAVFQTSGTTAGAERRGRHYFPDLTLYDAALRESFRAHLLPEGARLRMLSLVPARTEMPDSSLAHMIAEVMEEFGGAGSRGYMRNGALDHAGIAQALREAEASGEPVLLLGTSFAYVHLLDALRQREERFKLPGGSRLMDTGGFKGRSREVTREELYRELGEALGIPPEWCVNEYGMTEMSSQFYDAVAGDPGAAAVSERLHHAPPWVRTRATDPETLALLPDGSEGILRHWDLANLDSVLAIQTEDWGGCHPAGFRVLGRAAGAEARGCSIATDELLSALAARRGGESR
ncbi:MAG: long-chain fatty acid--CoA ligase [Longimicrobiaceae bacterium]